MKIFLPIEKPPFNNFTNFFGVGLALGFAHGLANKKTNSAFFAPFNLVNNFTKQAINDSWYTRRYKITAANILYREQFYKNYFFSTRP